jgi:hypothetical protein
VRQLAFLLQPSDAEFNSMLADLAAKMGWHGVGAVLGISQLTLNSWRTGANGPSAGAKKLVWLVWSLNFRRHNLQTHFHIASWGKFAVASERDDAR